MKSKEWFNTKPLWFKIGIWFGIINFIISLLTFLTEVWKWYDSFLGVIVIIIIRILSIITYPYYIIVIAITIYPILFPFKLLGFSDEIFLFFIKPSDHIGSYWIPQVLTVLGLITVTFMSFVYGAIVGLIISKIKTLITKKP